MRKVDTFTTQRLISIVVYTVLIMLNTLTRSSYANSCISDRRIERELKPCYCETLTTSQPSFTCQSVMEVDIIEKFDIARHYFRQRNVTSFELLIHGFLGKKMNINILSDGTFDNFIFTNQIAITNTNLQLIHVNAFRASFSSTITINLQYNKLINSPNNDPNYDIFNTINQFSNIRIVSLQNNLLTHVPRHAFKNMDKLEGIKLSNNQISVIGDSTLINVPNLKYVGLDSNKLSYIPDDFFDHFQDSSFKLDIDLRMNNLNGNSLPPLSALTRRLYLRLNNNNLTFIKEETFKEFLTGINGSTVDVGQNQFDCGCNVYWLMENAAIRRRMEDNIRNLRCPGGDSIWKWSVSDFSNCAKNNFVP